MPPTTGQGHGGKDFPGILYLDHAQIKLMHRRISHIKERLAAENVEFMKTKGGRYNAHSSLANHDDHDDAMEALTQRNNRQPSKMG
jgi:hypothetical protein